MMKQDLFCQLLSYHPPSINMPESSIEDRGDLALAIQQIMKQLVIKSVSPSPIFLAVTVAGLEKVHWILSKHCIQKLYCDCTGNTTVITLSCKSFKYIDQNNIGTKYM